MYGPFVDYQPDSTTAEQELKRLDAQIDSAHDLNALKPIFYRLEEITKAHAADFDVQTLVSDVKQHLMSRGVQLKQQGQVATATNPIGAGTFGAPPPPPMPSSSLPAVPQARVTSPTMGEPFHPPTRADRPNDPVLAAPPPLDATREVFIPPVRTPTPPPLPPAGPEAAPVNWKKPVLIGGGIGLLLVLLAIGVRAYINRPHPPPPVAAVPVNVATIPPGADVRVNDQSRCTSDCRVALKPGVYALSAILPGYDETKQSITVEKGHPFSLSLTLKPLPPSLKIVTDLGGAGKVALDGNPAGELQDGQFFLDRVPEGQHQVVISGNRGAQVEFSFQISPGAPPAIVGPVKTKNLTAVLASGMGSQVHLVTGAPVKVSLDGNPAGDAGPDGIDLKDVRPGDHEITLSDGKGEDRKVTLTTTPAAFLTAWVNASTSGGTLVVNVGEDGAVVTVDGRPQKRKTTHGQLTIPSLDPKDYKVKVSKPGFQDAPEQTASIKKGSETRLNFKLQPIPQAATLRITGGTPGAGVFIDNQNVGQIGADGALAYPSVAPGDHAVEFRKEGYPTKTTIRTFRQGETIELSSDAVLERPTGTLKLTVTPKEAQITIHRAGESGGGNPIQAGSHSLPAGSYTISGKAPGYQDASITTQIKNGELTAADLKLPKEGGPPPKPTFSRADWEHPGEWKPDQGWLVHTGGGFVPFGAKPSTGAFTFAVQLLKGGNFLRKHGIQWRADYVDDKNYVQFTLDNKSFETRVVVNGKGTNKGKSQIDGVEEPYYLQIEIAPDSIVHRLKEGDQWVEIGRLAQPGANNGKFGFYIPGKDEVAISNFKYEPR